MRLVFILNAVHQWERIGILTLSSVLKHAGHSVFLLNLQGKSEAEMVQEVGALSPDILAYSAMTTEIAGFLAINRLLNRELGNGFKSVFGGPHPTFFPEMIQQPGVDAVCRGEAEESLLVYLEYLNGGTRPECVRGFVLREGERIFENPLAGLVVNLDGVLYPDRALWDSVDPSPSQRAFFASRGCPYQCTYCFNHRFNGLYGNPKPVVRRRSVANLITEVKEVLARYPAAYPFFDDDSFLLAPFSWLEEFREAYRREVARPFACNIRADQVTEDKVRVLAEAGCHHCWFGLECGDGVFSKQVLRRNLSPEKILFTARTLRKYGIRFATQNINALPSADPLATDTKTIALNVLCKPDYAHAHVFFPFPGTELAAYSQQKGLWDGDNSKLDDALCLSSPLSFEPKLKVQLERQAMLFSLAVAFSAVRPLLPLLRRLPLNRLYVVLSLLYSGYCTRIKLTPVKKGFHYVVSLFTLFLVKLTTGKRAKRG
jgi:radical SAM superfamily enzyme YgiQ (UPF0313 family)